MAHPDHALWRQSWRDNRIDFHRGEVNPLLIRCWAALGLQPDDRVFVPLCGKSLDLMWLHGLGHDVTGVELSPVAVRDFFRASRLQPVRSQRGAFSRWGHERLLIYCGDFFRLTAADLLGVRAVYDRASLTALPEDLRAAYVAHLHAILPAGCQILLLTVEDLEVGESDEAACLASAEIAALYFDTFAVDMRHVECVPAVLAACGEEVEPRSVHKAYVLGRVA
jgi:thiopurine S-methyltransferase